MKIGIIGLPQVGKKTLFELLTGQVVEVTGGKQEIKMGAARIRDSRFDALVEMYHPQKISPATLEVVLLPKFDQDEIKSGEFLKAVEKCDALCHVARAFEDESVFHVDGSVNALRDIEKVSDELVISDLILVEKRLERMELDKKKGVATSTAEKEKEVLLRMKELLDENKPLVDFEMNADETKLMSTYQFLTRRAMILVLNVNDDKINDNALLASVRVKYPQAGIKCMQISAKIECELSSLDEEERKVFLEDLNIEVSALNQLSALCFDALGLICFFTVGTDEVRAWNTKKNSSAPVAAGAIHSDLERGFIRAEIMKSAELIEAQDEMKLKEDGRFMLKGKDYIVEDGDIMHVRFNV